MTEQLTIEQQHIISDYACMHSYSSVAATLPQKYVYLSDEVDDEVREWANGWNGTVPDFVEEIESEDDGSSHDVSRIRYYRAGDYAIYSYNNNAWGHCDVLPIAADPGSISAWCSNWDIDNMERWMAELCDREGEFNEHHGELQ